MTKTQIAIGAALLAGILSTPLIIQQQALATARAEQSELQARLRDLPAQPVQPARQVPGTIDIAARDRADLERLRVEAAALRAKIADYSAQAKELAAAIPGHKPDGIPLGNALRARDARDAGQATPAAALQTLLWAMLQGETNRITQLLVSEPGLDTQLFQKALDQLLRESAGMRSNDHTGESENMEVQFLEEQPGENNDRWIVMESTGTNGTVRRSRVLFRPTDLGWRQVVDNNGDIVQQPIPDQP
jgi:hypothetical protein